MCGCLFPRDCGMRWQNHLLDERADERTRRVELDSGIASSKLSSAHQRCKCCSQRGGMGGGWSGMQGHCHVDLGNRCWRVNYLQWSPVDWEYGESRPLRSYLVERLGAKGYYQY